MERINKFIGTKFIFFYSLVILIFCIVLHSQRTYKKPFDRLIRSDPWGYYQYLPATFIDSEHSKENLSKQVLEYTENPFAYKTMPWGVWYGDRTFKISVYQYGVAFLQTPFFLSAHLYCLYNNIDANGHNSYYAQSVYTAASVYLAIALFFLMVMAMERYNKLAVVLSVALLVFGTNLLYYATFEAGMSHVYSFFAATMFLFFLDKFIKQPTSKNVVLFSLFLGLLVAIRLYHAVFGLLVLFWAVRNKIEFKERISLFLKNPRYILIIALAVIVLFVPQMLYWKEVTGKFFVFTYGEDEQTFIYWKNPKLFQVLFDVQNGWLIYSPIMLVSMIGLVVGLIKKEYFSISTALLFCISIYIISSWWAWWFGAAFGHRAFIDYYPVYFIPMCYMLDRWMKTKAIYFLLPIFVLFVSTNYHLTRMYNAPWDGDQWTWHSLWTVIISAYQ